MSREGGETEQTQAKTITGSATRDSLILSAAARSGFDDSLWE